MSLLNMGSYNNTRKGEYILYSPFLVGKIYDSIVAGFI
jgi:hypothetical protein